MTHPAADEIDLAQCLRFIWERKVWLGFCGALFALLGAFVSFATWDSNRIFSASFLVPADGVSLLGTVEKNWLQSNAEMAQKASLRVELSTDPSPLKEGAGQQPTRIVNIFVTAPEAALANQTLESFRKASEESTRQLRSSDDRVRMIWTFPRLFSLDEDLKWRLSDSNLQRVSRILPTDDGEAWTVEKLRKNVLVVSSGSLDLPDSQNETKLMIEAKNASTAQSIFKFLILSDQASESHSRFAVASALFFPHPAQSLFGSFVSRPETLDSIWQKHWKTHAGSSQLLTARRALSDGLSFSVQAPANKLEGQTSKNSSLELFQLQYAHSDPRLALQVLISLCSELQDWVRKSKPSLLLAKTELLKPFGLEAGNPLLQGQSQKPMALRQNMDLRSEVELKLLSGPQIVQLPRSQSVFPHVEPETVVLKKWMPQDFQVLVPLALQSALTQKLNASRKLFPILGLFFGFAVGLLIQLLKRALVSSSNPAESFSGNPQTKSDWASYPAVAVNQSRTNTPRYRLPLRPRTLEQRKRKQQNQSSSQGMPL